MRVQNDFVHLDEIVRAADFVPEVEEGKWSISDLLEIECQFILLKGYSKKRWSICSFVYMLGFVVVLFKHHD